MKHARRTIAALGVAAVLAAAGCSSGGSGSSSSGAATSGGAASSAPASGAGSDQARNFAYANISDSSPLFKLVGDTMVSNGKKVNITVTRFDNNLDPSKALSNAQLMVQEKPDVAIDWTGTESIGASIGAVFQRALDHR